MRIEPRMCVCCVFLCVFVYICVCVSPSVFSQARTYVIYNTLRELGKTGSNAKPILVTVKTWGLPVTNKVHSDHEERSIMLRWTRNKKREPAASTIGSFPGLTRFSLFLYNCIITPRNYVPRKNSPRVWLDQTSASQGFIIEHQGDKKLYCLTFPRAFSLKDLAVWLKRVALSQIEDFQETKISMQPGLCGCCMRAIFLCVAIRQSTSLSRY